MGNENKGSFPRTQGKARTKPSALAMVHESLRLGIKKREEALEENEPTTRGGTATLTAKRREKETFRSGEASRTNTEEKQVIRRVGAARSGRHTSKEHKETKKKERRPP